MVVFTCNNCGDSVNKPKVEKHIQYECKRKHFAVSLCCVDCLKDFNYETVKDHCQCVTEEQRYSAKGFVPKMSAEKGKRKQAGWVEIVQSLIDRKNLSNDERQFLNIIATFDNVPRKKNKFQNFCFSSAPGYRNKGYLIDKVFDMIEAEYKAQVQNSNDKSTHSNDIQNKNNSESLKKNVIVEEESDNVKEKVNSENIENEIVNKKTDETPKKKKKKSQQPSDIKYNEIENQLEENIEPLSETKKKRKLQDKVNEDSLNVKIKNTTYVQSDSVKKSKKKYKVEGTESDNIIKNDISNIENGSQNNNVIIGENELLSKKKKKKEKMLPVKVIEDDLNVKIKNTTEVQSDSLKKSKKKCKVKDVESNDTIESGSQNNKIINEENGTFVKTSVKKSKKKCKVGGTESNGPIENDISNIENGSQNNGTINGKNGTLVETTVKKSKKKCKVEGTESNGTIENDISNVKNRNQNNRTINGENGTLVETSEVQLSKKEKKELKKKRKYEQELANITNGVIETDKEPVLKKKKRELNDNDGNKEPQQKILKTEKTSQVPGLVQSKSIFEWNTAINQVLQKKKDEPTSVSEVLKIILGQYISLSKTTEKLKLERIFLKKLKKMENVVINNDEVQITE